MPPLRPHACLGTLALMAACISMVAGQSADPVSQKFDSLATANLAQDQAVGAAVAVIRGSDTLFFRGYGQMDIESNVPMSTDAIFGIGSITKQFTAAAILQLHDGGKLDLDDELTKWLPDFPAHADGVTLRRLLNHTSGIQDFTETWKFGELVHSAAFPPDSIYSLIKRYPVQFRPGAAQVYNNSAYWLLHRVIEKASGLSYQRYLESRIFEPLGMTDSGSCLSDEHHPGRAQGYHVRNGSVRRAPLNVASWYLGSGDLCSTVGDLVRWLKALHGGAVLSPASYGAMTEPATLRDGTRTRYGMGLELGPDVRGLDFMGHSGEILGYGARANWYPDAEMAIVVLINNSGDVSATAMANDLAAEVLPVRSRVERPFEGDPAPLVGTYRGPARGGHMVVDVTGNPAELAISVDGGPTRPLSWVEGLTFRGGSALLTFDRGTGNSAEAAALRYDAGSGYYILERLTPTQAVLVRTHLLLKRHLLVVLLGLAGFTLLGAFALFRRFIAFRRSRVGAPSGGVHR